jgi:hypothetical protein
MNLFLITSALVGIILLFVAKEITKHLRRIYISTCKYCDAEEAFINWRLSNPHIYVGLSDKAKELLGKYIIAYDEFLKMHPYVDGEKHREWLHSLYNDLPPRPHKPSSIKTESAPAVRFFS